MKSGKSVLEKGYVLDEKYHVLLFIKSARDAETYRVKTQDGSLYFLKLFHYHKLDRSAFDDDRNLLEIELVRKVDHKNLSTYRDSGEVIIGAHKYGYLVMEFISGETLSERMARAPFTLYLDIKQVMTGVLSGLDHLHRMPEVIIHNEITPQNIMLDLSGNDLLARIIDFGHARSFFQSSKTYNKAGLDLNYMASECFNSIFSPQSDIFSAGAVMYYLLFGLPPWHREISTFDVDQDTAEDMVLKDRLRKLRFPEVTEQIIGYDTAAELILKKALHQDPDSRFQSASEFLQALKGDIEVEDVDLVQKILSDESALPRVRVKNVQGSGFDAIAGMQELKDQLRTEVIEVLENPEEYARYGVSLSNGMLLYGPPGCGKTFFAKHFAEEVGFNYIYVDPGTLKSRFVNATEENIARMFKEAEENAPTIIFIDEISGLFPSRDSEAHEMSRNAVDALLAQMDSTGERGVFVICATNYPEKIDAALLRAGRLDKKYYLGPPDQEARMALFRMYLKDRPLDFGIDYDRLATATENYVASDIKVLIVDEASRDAFRSKSRITMDMLLDVISKTRPSVAFQELQKYEAIRSRMEGSQSGPPPDRPRIGFK